MMVKKLTPRREIGDFIKGWVAVPTAFE